MIQVSLVTLTQSNPSAVISQTAKTCYQNVMPELGSLINIKERLWETGHHTTLQPFHLTFHIEGIAVGDITLGLHLASPFYVSGQRSGRFCGAMFSAPDFNLIEGYMDAYWPEPPKSIKKEAMDYIKYALGVYGANIDSATKRAAEFIKEERPYASAKYIEQNAPKIAQEQLRVIIPVIFPTAVNFTVNLSALAALYRVAWSPAMKDVTGKMASIVIGKYPELAYLFERYDGSDASDIVTALGPISAKEGILKKPEVELLAIDDGFVAPDHKMINPLDILRFSPSMMENNVEGIKTLIKISLATMGQDQRHRTIGRGFPSFTGEFYLPPVPDSLGIETVAEKVRGKWLDICGKLNDSFSCVLAPYGAMVRYKKFASYNAAIHEGAKRLCWCAQEEIYHAFQRLRSQIVKRKSEEFPFLKTTSPNCVLTGKCGEGVRYCGRNLNWKYDRFDGDPFPERRV
jgi:hypothetical protein